MDLTQAFFLLKSLKQNLPDSFTVEKKWVDDFHSILDTVEKETGADLAAFRVLPGDVYKPALGRTATGVTRYGNLSIERTRLLHKVDAVLGYFTLESEPKQSIGFKKP